MKSAQLSSRGGNSRPKKGARDKEKKQPPASDSNNRTQEISSPSKDTKFYAGIDSKSISIYAEQCGIDNLDSDVSNILAENINYKLRNVINDALIKARLCGRNLITKDDVEHTFYDFNIEKVLGAKSDPVWIPFSYQNLYILEDEPVNLVDLSKRVECYQQNVEVFIARSWMPTQEIGQNLQNYFTITCKAVLSKNNQLRKEAIYDVYRNPRIGNITLWFYNFCYVILAKNCELDIAFKVLDLLEILELSPTCRLCAPEKQLDFIVRLLLQRILSTTDSDSFLRPACRVLAILCRREILKEFILIKVSQKMSGLNASSMVPLLLLANYLGIVAVNLWILPYLYTFLDILDDTPTTELTNCLLDLYRLLIKEDCLKYTHIFQEIFGDSLTIFITQNIESKVPEKEEINFVRMKCKFMKTWRKKEFVKKAKEYPGIRDVFILPDEPTTTINESGDDNKIVEGRVRFTLKNRRIQWKTSEINGCKGSEIKPSLIIGKTKLILPIFKVFKQVSHPPVSPWYNL